MTRRIAAAVFALLLAALAVRSEEPPKPPAELEKIRREIATLKSRLDELKSKTQSAEEQIRAYDLQIAIQSREIELARHSRERIAKRRDEMAAEIIRLTAETGREERVVSRRLGELYRLGGLSYWRILLSIDKRRNPLEAISMLSYLVARDARQMADYRRNQKQLAEQRGRLETEEAALVRLAAEVEARHRAISNARASQAQLLASLNVRTVESSRRLAELEEKARRLERLFALLYSRNQGAGGKQRIAEFRGALDWPVRGRILESFGKHRSQQFATYTMSNGVRIAAAPNTPVRSVFTGTVLYAQWFKGYGNLIIIDHGERIFSLYGNTRMAMVKVGEAIAAGQTIATVNDDEEGKSGYLYFEIRESNKPVDPIRWLR
jgi:septal ring factor EnvC (AmiA/AmiB activator)